MTHWYTADLHLGHENILRLASRPFRSISHMDGVLIERLWEAVAPDDVLWVVGDFAFGPRAKDLDWLMGMFVQLPGAQKHLVIGNHDGEATQSLPWDSVSQLAEVADPVGDHPLVLCHYPMMTWHRARKGALHFFGHVHGNWRGGRGCVNVGVDVWDYRPVTFDEARRRSRAMSTHDHWSDVEHGTEPL